MKQGMDLIKETLSRVEESPEVIGIGRGGVTRRSGVLERSAPHSLPVAIDPERLGASARAKRIRGRTIYLPDDLFERILVQAHRRDRTIREYVAGILERQVPDHRIARAETVGESAESGAA